MGPIEHALRKAGEDLTQGAALAWVLAPVGSVAGARRVVYEADMQLREDRGEPHSMARGLSDIVTSGDLEDVLTEAICAAEALCL